MSMLAGPRTKQKVINLRAKNNAWSNDATKFGQRMLEKMGWSEGKGLGAKENGIVEHVVARYKNDDRGLGYEDRNDQWTKHEDDFNALLANLSDGKDDNKMHSGVSLEVKSKKSKTRIHYHKFTRGKDLSRYSEKDLANIFGKKSLKEQQLDTNTSTPTEMEEDKKFTEKGSMADYFKTKLAALNYKKPEQNLSDNENGSQGFGYNLDSESKQYCGFGYDRNTNDSSEFQNNFHGFGFQKANDITPELRQIETDSQDASLESTVKNKKKKKSKHEVNDSESLDFTKEVQNNFHGFGFQKANDTTPVLGQREIVSQDASLESTVKNKKKKKSKHEVKDSEPLDSTESKTNEDTETQEESGKLKTKDKKKNRKKSKQNPKTTYDQEPLDSIECKITKDTSEQEETGFKTNDKKKSKKKSKQDPETNYDQQFLDETTREKKKKKRLEESVPYETEDAPKKKKKNR